MKIATERGLTHQQSITTKDLLEQLPKEPHVFVERNDRKLTSDFWRPKPNTNVVNFLKNTLYFVSFEWLNWGNATGKDVKQQVIQEVTNFGILSALSLSLNISVATVVDSNHEWNGAFREVMGVIFNVSCSSFIISLLSSAFLLLLINETPDGRAVNIVIDYVNYWFRVPGLSFVVGIYGFAGILILWIFHEFYFWISVGVTAAYMFLASYAIMGSVTQGMIALHNVMDTYGILTIADDVTVHDLLEFYLTKAMKSRDKVSTLPGTDGSKANHRFIPGFRRSQFYAWVLAAYDCCEFCDITNKRLDKIVEKWENEMAGIEADK